MKQGKFKAFPILPDKRKRIPKPVSFRGELEIRTLGEVSPHTRFPVVRLRPLSQLSTGGLRSRILIISKNQFLSRALLRTQQIENRMKDILIISYAEGILSHTPLAHYLARVSVHHTAFVSQSIPARLHPR